jgi:hypothetical protein
LGGGGGGIDVALAGDGKRLVMKEKREAFVELDVVGRGGSASTEGRDVALTMSDCEVWVRGSLGALWGVAWRLRIWSS